MTTGHRRQEGARHGLRHPGAEDGAHAFVAEGFGARMDEDAALEGEDGVEVPETVPDNPPSGAPRAEAAFLLKIFPVTVPESGAYLS